MPFEPTETYPDPRLRVLKPAAEGLFVFNSAVERLADGCRWAEGPVWFGDHGCLVWSDIPNDRMLRWDERSGTVQVFRSPSHYANGNTRDQQGRLISCEHQTARVTRTEPDGTITVLADTHDGRQLNSPNDVVVSSDGAVWFSDPHYGLTARYEGGGADREQRPGWVYRIDPDSGSVDAVVTELEAPNGLALAPDERTLYIVDSGDGGIYRWDVATGGPPTQFVAGGDGQPDGLRVDERGNLWCGWGGSPDDNGVRVYSPDAELIAFIDLPARCANLTFGGLRGDRLFMACCTSIYSVFTGVRGAVR